MCVRTVYLNTQSHRHGHSRAGVYDRCFLVMQRDEERAAITPALSSIGTAHALQCSNAGGGRLPRLGGSASAQCPTSAPPAFASPRAARAVFKSKQPGLFVARSPACARTCVGWPRARPRVLNGGQQYSRTASRAGRPALPAGVQRGRINKYTARLEITPEGGKEGGSG